MKYLPHRGMHFVALTFYHVTEEGLAAYQKRIDAF